MTKRAIITKDKFRISGEGVDVDSANEHQFVLHESHLAAQPYWTRWVPCPFADAGSGFFEATVAVPPPPVVLPNTTVIFYTQGSSYNNYYPANIVPSLGGPVDAWFTRLVGDLNTKTSLSIYFTKSGSSQAPRGAWVIYLRSTLS